MGQAAAHRLRAVRVAARAPAPGGPGGRPRAREVAARALEEPPPRERGAAERLGERLVPGAAQAVLEVAAQVREQGVEAPDAAKSFVALDREGAGTAAALGEGGLPLVYDRRAIQKYWDSQPGELQARWGEFLAVAVPFLTKVAGVAVTGGGAALRARDGELAKDAVRGMERLGPTYIKVGQMMSVRPDVIGPNAMAELAQLQDAVEPFSSAVALGVVEAELGRPLDEVFAEFSEEPVAAASLSQVYRARLRGSGEEVAVKVQRPRILETVSKDLYVLRRASEVYQGLMDRFLPQQQTDYRALLNEWAVGFYTELDFLNEAKNQATMKDQLRGLEGIYVPEVFFDYTTRRVLVTEWIDGVKLSKCEPEEIKELVKLGQECFLEQLLTHGFFHADPHPGNLMRLDDESKGRLALIDFGLIARLSEEDRVTIINCIVHITNKDFAALTDDFVDLGMLPPETDRVKVRGLSERVLSPYLYAGGGATGAFQAFQDAPGGFQQLTGDLVSAMSDVPFAIPSYFALLGRAIAVLEGIALQGDPNYRLVIESYPFVARQLAGGATGGKPGLQRALSELLISDGGRLQPRRLASLISSAMGEVAAQGTFVDPDAVDLERLDLKAQLKFLLSPEGEALRQGFLEDEALEAADLLARQALRRVANSVVDALPRLPSFPLPLPPLPFAPPTPPLPVLVPTATGYAPTLVDPAEFLDLAAPPLSTEEEVYARGVSDLVLGAVGGEAGFQEQVGRLVPALVESLAGGGAAGPAGPGTSLAAVPAGEGNPLEEILNAVRGLEEAERGELLAAGTRVFDRLQARLAERLKPLVAA